MTYRRASAFSLAELTAHWNQGYAGYFVPVQYSEAQLARHIRVGSIDLDGSIVRLDGDALVGFGFLGRRGDRGWIGGFGVAPDHRGRGLASEILAKEMSVARDSGLAEVGLEVLRQNWAHKVYARGGFATTRELIMLSVTMPDPDRDAAAAPAAGAGRIASDAEYAAHHARLHAAFPACWQRELASLAGDPAGEVIAVGPDDAPTAMLVLGPHTTGLRIRDAAAIGRSSAEALIAALAHRHPGEAISIVNEPAGSPLHDALIAAGATAPLGQYEMRWARPA